MANYLGKVVQPIVPKVLLRDLSLPKSVEVNDVQHEPDGLVVSEPNADVWAVDDQ